MLDFFDKLKKDMTFVMSFFLEVTPRFELQGRVLRGVKSCDFVPLCGHSVAFHGMR